MGAVVVPVFNRHGERETCEQCLSAKNGMRDVFWRTMDFEGLQGGKCVPNNGVQLLGVASWIICMQHGHPVRWRTELRTRIATIYVLKF